MQWLIDIATDWFKLYIKGMIVLWSGAVVDIPDDWHLCDGTNGTPDLQGQFIPGGGGTYETGGHNFHRHLFTSDVHTHEMSTPAVELGLVAGTIWDKITDARTVVGPTGYVYHRPPYYALAYIMKL